MIVTATQRAAVFGQPGKVDRVQVVTPWGIAVQCHELIAPTFLAACRDAAHCTWEPQRIDSYNPRPIRGYDGDRLSEWSLHSWALAWDFFATPPNVPPPGGVWTPENGVPEDFARCFEAHGFRWGGRWASRVDVPHIEWAGGHPPATPRTEDTMTPEQEARILDKIGAVYNHVSDRTGAVYNVVAKLPNATQIADAVVAKLPASSGGGVSKADVKAAVIDVLRTGVG